MAAVDPDYCAIRQCAFNDWREMAGEHGRQMLPALAEEYRG
jgi:hypothetical protein